MPAVTTPTDSLFVLADITTDIDSDCREFVYPGIGRIVVAPSSYALKRKDMVGVQVSHTHPAWLHSGLHYDDDNIGLFATFRHYRNDDGSSGSISIPNVKKASQVTTMDGASLPSTISSQAMNNIPVHYYGTSVESKKPTDPGYMTFLTEIIDEDYIKVRCLSPFEYEIEVVQVPPTDQWFYLPSSSAKGMSNTTWGKIGYESTLPTGAAAGLIKVRAECLIDSQSGVYLLSGNELTAVRASSRTLFQQSATMLYSLPSWYTNLGTTTIEGLAQYQTIKAICNAQKEYFACGYKAGCCTVGTGLFVRNNNKPSAMSFGKAASGVNYKKKFAQSAGSVVKTVTMGEMLDCGGDFFESIARSSLDTELLPSGSIIPLCASELQYISKTSGPSGLFEPPINPSYNYNYAFFGTNLPVTVTPVYIPSADGQHCYMPGLQQSTSTIVGMLQVSMLSADVNLVLKADPSWLVPDVNQAATTHIQNNWGMDYVGAGDPTNGRHRDQFGFVITHSDGSRWYPTGNGGGYTRYWCDGKIDWVNPTGDPVIGAAATTSRPSNNPMISGMIMAFVGVIPKDTPVGTYLWKPFATVETTADCLVANGAQYTVTPMNAKIKPDTTYAPYIGTNVITAECVGITWDFQKVTSGAYTYYQVLKNVSLNSGNPGRIVATRFFVVDVDNVPLIGYPVSNRPTLIDIDDWGGDRACDIGDIAMTGPFYDAYLDQWVVVAASAEMKKFYRIDVEVDKTHNYVTQFLRIRDSKELFDTPFGNFVEILGLCHTADLHYLDEEEMIRQGLYAADILFLVEDSSSMSSALSQLKNSIGDLVKELNKEHIENLRVGMAVYDTVQYPLADNTQVPAVRWATDYDGVMNMADQLDTEMTPGSTDYSAHHWSAIDWALRNYGFRSVKNKYIVLVTDSDNESDPLTTTDVQQRLIDKNIRLDAIVLNPSYFQSIVDATDGTLIDMTTRSGEWGKAMSETLSANILYEIQKDQGLYGLDSHLVVYGRTEYEDSDKVKGTNLVIGTCRDYMEWDANKDTISRVRVSDVLPYDFRIDADVNWPRSVAVLFPYIYILGFNYQTTPSDPITDPLLSSTINITGAGWQMALWKVDITSGQINEVIPLYDASTYRTTFGIHAIDKDASRLIKSDKNALGGTAKYAFGPDDKYILPASASLPSKKKWYELPSVAGICGVSGQLLAFSNYHEQPVLINPVTGCIETVGFNVFPFTYPFNGNVSVSNDKLTAISQFGGRNYYNCHPFFHVCIGDGLPPNRYGEGIDIQDITNGHKLLRLCRLRNNLLRDRLENVKLSVPDPTLMPGSEMIWLSLTGNDSDKAKEITFPDPIHPCASAEFYIHVEPNGEVDDGIILYVNSQFGRITEYFGYIIR